MKFRFSLIALLVLALAVASCKKDDAGKVVDNGNNNSNNGGGNGGEEPQDTIPVMEWSVGGTDYISDSVTVQENDSIRIYTAYKGTKRIIFTTSYFAPGTYDLNQDNPSIVYRSGSITYNPAFVNTGSLLIATASGSRISGSFVADVQDIAVTGQTVSIENGIFSYLPY